MPTTSNVQDKITYAFTKQDVTLTHPSGVKVKETKAQVQAQLDRLQADADTAVARKAAVQSDILDKIDASLVDGTP